MEVTVVLVCQALKERTARKVSIRITFKTRMQLFFFPLGLSDLNRPSTPTNDKIIMLISLYTHFSLVVCGEVQSLQRN